MDYDQEKLDEVALALLLLTLHDVCEFGGRAWKGMDWGVLDRLHEKGWIGSPKGKAKSVTLSAEGIAHAEKMFQKHFAKAAGK